MANKSDKRIASENAATLALLKYGFLITHLLQLLCFSIFRSQRTRSHIILYLITTVPSLFIYAQLHSMGRPRRSNPNKSGSVEVAGDDLSQPGLTQYMLDVVFVTWAAQVLSLLSSKAWWIFAIIPAFAAYKIFGIAKPFLFKNSGESAGAASSSRSSGQQQQQGVASKEGLSKRQQKMQARYEKGDRRYQMVERQVPQ